MNKSDIVPGAFYFHTKCHYVFLADQNKNLVNLESGCIQLESTDPRVKNNYWKFFRPALQDEIVRVLNKNVNFRRTSLNQVIISGGITSRCCQVAVKPESIRTKNYKCSHCDNSCATK